MTTTYTHRYGRIYRHTGSNATRVRDLSAEASQLEHAFTAVAWIRNERLMADYRSAALSLLTALQSRRSNVVQFPTNRKAI